LNKTATDKSIEEIHFASERQRDAEETHEMSSIFIFSAAPRLCVRQAFFNSNSIRIHSKKFAKWGRIREMGTQLISTNYQNGDAALFPEKAISLNVFSHNRDGHRAA
jgi:hypothetical protein